MSAFEVSDQDNAFADAVSQFMPVAGGYFDSILANGAYSPSVPTAAVSQPAYASQTPDIHVSAMSGVKPQILAIRYALVNNPNLPVYTTSNLPAASAAMKGAVVMTSNGAPMVSGLVFTALTGAPGPVGCDGSHWYNGIGHQVA